MLVISGIAPFSIWFGVVVVAIVVAVVAMRQVLGLYLLIHLQAVSNDENMISE